MNKLNTHNYQSIDSLVVQYYAFTAKTTVPINEDDLSKIQKNGISYGKFKIIKKPSIDSLFHLLSQRVSKDESHHSEDFRMLLSFYSKNKLTFFLLDRNFFLTSEIGTGKLDMISQKKLFSQFCIPNCAKTSFSEKKYWQYSNNCE